MYGIDEAAHARPIVDENDRRLARPRLIAPSGIAVVDDVRWQAAVFRRLVRRLLSKCPVRSIQTEAGRLDFADSFQSAMRIASARLRRSSRRSAPRTLRSSHTLVGADRRPRRRLHLAPGGSLADGHGNDVPHLQGAALHAADARLMEGRARSEPRLGARCRRRSRHSSACRRGPRPSPAPALISPRSSRHSGTGASSSFAPISAPASAITVSRWNFSVGPIYCASSPAAPGALPTSTIGKPKRPRIHRPGRRKPLVPIADAARVVLHRRFQPGLQHLDHDRPLRSEPLAAVEARDPGLVVRH